MRGRSHAVLLTRRSPRVLEARPLPFVAVGDGSAAHKAEVSNAGAPGDSRRLAWAAGPVLMGHAVRTLIRSAGGAAATFSACAHPLGRVHDVAHIGGETGARSTHQATVRHQGQSSLQTNVIGRFISCQPYTLRHGRSHRHAPGVDRGRILRPGRSGSIGCPVGTT